MARGRSRNADSTAHSYWIQTLNDARNNARQAIISAEAWGLSPESSVGPVDVDELSTPQKIMAQAHSYTLDYYDHLAPWKSRHEDLWEQTIYRGPGPTGEFETVEERRKHVGAVESKEPKLETIDLALGDIPEWRMRIITVENGAEPERYKLYLPAGACHAIYHQLMYVQRKLDMAADVGPIVPSGEDVGVVTHDGIDYSEFESDGGIGQ